MIQLNSLCYSIKGRKIIHDLSAVLRRGEFVSVIGSNGAGKSTLLKLIAGQLRPDHGDVFIQEKSVSCYRFSELAGQRAFLHQSNEVQVNFSVEQVVMMGRYWAKTSIASNREIVLHCLSLCELSSLKDRSIRQLSGGEQQRVHFARVLAQLWDVDGGILLLDEPIASMDIQYQHLVLALAKAFTQAGFTIVAVLHDINLVAQYSDQVMMLKSGRKWWYGTPQEVLNTEQLFSIFGIEAKVEIDKDTWKPQIHTKIKKFDIGDFHPKYV